MTWVDAVPWKKVIKRAWQTLAFDRQGRSRERAIIMIGALVVTVFLYLWAVDTVDPSRNIVRLGWQRLANPDHVIASGTLGGWYFDLAQVIDAGLKGEGKFKAPPQKVGGSSKILRRVIAEPRAVGFVQHDALSRGSANGTKVKVIAPIYNERLHIVYRWSKLQDLAAFGQGACPELQDLPDKTCDADVMLSETPDCLTSELFRQSTVRLGSTGRPVGYLNTAQRVLAMAGLQPAEEEYKLSIKQTIDALINKEIDIGFITSGAPVKPLEEAFKEGTECDLCLASVDGRFTRLLNDVYGTDYRFSGFSQIYQARFDRVATFEVSAMLVANPRVSRSFIRSVGHALVEEKKAQPEDHHHPLEDFDQIDTLVTELPSQRLELVQAGALFGLFGLVVWSALIGLATWIVSSFKEAGYARRLQRVYEQLPSHAELEQGGDRLPIPKSDETSEVVVSKIVVGIADLLRLAMDIRSDYETGGITSSHHHHLIESVYDVKAIFMRHLAQRLHSLIETDGEVSSEQLTRYYTAGYLFREDYCFLRGLPTPEAEGTKAPSTRRTPNEQAVGSEDQKLGRDRQEREPRPRV